MKEILPKGWSYKKLDSLCLEISLGKTPPRHAYANNGYKIIKFRDIVEDGLVWDNLENGFVKPNYGKINQLKQLQERDILITASAHSVEQIGKKTAFVWQIPSQFNRVFFVGELMVIRANERRVLPKLLYYVTKTPWFYSDIQKRLRGGHLLPTQIKDVEIPLPPLEEQHQIVTILDTVERLREKRREAIRILQKLPQALFIKMFGDPASNPKGWPMRTVGEILTIKGGKRLPKGSQYSSIPTPYRYLRITDVKDGRINIDSMKFLSEEVQKKISRYTVEAGDVVISIAGEAGIVAEIPKHEGIWNLTENMALMRPKDSKMPAVLPTYLACAFQTSFVQSQIANLKGTSTVQKLALYKLAQIIIPVPPITIQQRFASYIEQIEQLYQKQVESMKTLDYLFSSVMARAFTGELTVFWRKKQAEKITFTDRQQAILALLLEAKRLGVAQVFLTALVKYLFLLQTKKGIRFSQPYNFIPYKYGPFTKEIYEDLEELEKKGYLTINHMDGNGEVEKMGISLSPDRLEDVVLLSSSFSAETLQSVREIIGEYGSLPLNELLAAVYKEFPEYAVRSQWKGMK